MIRVLAADTTTDFCSVAVCECGAESQILSEINLLARRRHSELLVTLCEQVLEYAQLSLQSIDVLAISNGPGSFTGLRVGVSTWKGLALGAGLPLYGVSTLEAMARRLPVANVPIVPMLDAKMDEVFAAEYAFEQDRFREIVKPTVATVEAFAKQLSGSPVVFGDGAIRFRERLFDAVPSIKILGEAFTYPRATEIAALAAQRFEEGDPGDADSVRPVYLRKSQAERVHHQPVPSQ